MKNEDIKLKLIGKSIEDLKTISAYLQDSIVTINDIIFLKTNKIFIIIVNITIINFLIIFNYIETY